MTRCSIQIIRSLEVPAMQSFDEGHQMSEEALIRAAEVIRTRGFNAASVKQISDAVGITKGGLYYYVKGKQDLLYQIMRYGLEMLEEWTRSVESVEDPARRLRSMVRMHVEAIARGKGALTVVSDEDQSLEPDDRADILRRKRRYFDFIRGILEEMSSQGRLRDTDLSVATFNLLGMILHFARWYRPDGRMNPVEIADEMVDLTLRGLEIPARESAADKLQ
jgi:AcrR family transcriptional regulator